MALRFSGINMFETLSKRMTDAFSVISPKSSLTEDNVQKVVKDIRVGLLEADVALSVIDDFISKVKSRFIPGPAGVFPLSFG